MLHAKCKTHIDAQSKHRRLKETSSGYLFIAHNTLFYTIFIGVPVFMTVFILSFSDFSLLTSLKFVGLRNFERLFTDHANMQRVYACNDDQGLLMTTWPFGGRPKHSFFYSEEAWGRTEYHVASTLIYQGLVEEGLSVAKAVRGRYGGIKRNPFKEFECGWRYSGIMFSWTLLPALSGYRVDLPHGIMTFAPAIHQEDFQCFWSHGRAWGTYRQYRENGKMHTQVKDCSSSKARPSSISARMVAMI